MNWNLSSIWWTIPNALCNPCINIILLLRDQNKITWIAWSKMELSIIPKTLSNVQNLGAHYMQWSKMFWKLKILYEFLRYFVVSRSKSRSPSLVLSCCLLSILSVDPLAKVSDLSLPSVPDKLRCMDNVLRCEVMRGEEVRGVWRTSEPSEQSSLARHHPPPSVRILLSQSLSSLS